MDLRQVPYYENAITASEALYEIVVFFIILIYPYQAKGHSKEESKQTATWVEREIGDSHQY